MGKEVKPKERGTAAPRGIGCVYSCRSAVKTLSHLFSSRKLLALLLMASVLLAGGGWAAANALDQIEHGLEKVKTSSAKAPQERGGCDHGCAGHLGFHVSAPVSAGPVLREPRMSRVVFSAPEAPAIVSPKDRYLRPPRVSPV